MSKILVVCCLLLVVSFTNAQTKKPNVVLILADDLGWADLTCYGSTFYETPTLDKLASQGMLFRNAYASSPVCSPTRASILTGKYPVKTKVTDWIPGRQEDGKAKPYEKLKPKPTALQLSLSETTIAEYALENGYRTFIAGKWHLGEEEKFWPEQQGFEGNKGGWSKGSPFGRVNDSTGGYFTPYKNARLKDGPAGEYLTDRLTNETLEFIEQNKNQPFFVFFSLYAVHNPLQAPKKLIKKYQEKKAKLNIQEKDRFAKDEDWMKNEKDWKRRLVQDNPVYAAMIESMDTNIGKLIAKLEEANLDDNTLVIFTSDNGGLSTAEGSPTTNAPLRGGKGWLYEGGIRVPLIMYWKGKILPGSVSDIPVTSVDVFPTIATAINPRFEKDKTLDGENILKLLAENGQSKNRTLYWHYPHYSNQGGRPSSAIKEGNFKLIYNYDDGSMELYDVEKDIAEKNNLAGVDPKILNELNKKLQKWLRQNDAEIPVR